MEPVNITVNQLQFSKKYNISICFYVVEFRHQLKREKLTRNNQGPLTSSVQSFLHLTLICRWSFFQLPVDGSGVIPGGHIWGEMFKDLWPTSFFIFPGKLEKCITCDTSGEHHISSGPWTRENCQLQLSVSTAPKPITASTVKGSKVIDQHSADHFKNQGCSQNFRDKSNQNIICL